MNNRKSKKVIDDKKVSIDINNDVSSKTNNQDIKKNEVNQEKENESLEMKINELASLENIQKIAEEYGLSYINSNIKIIATE